MAGDILAAVVIIALLTERVFCERERNKILRRVLNQVAAQNTHELVLLNKTDEPSKPPVGSQDREVIHPIGA